MTDEETAKRRAPVALLALIIGVANIPLTMGMLSVCERFLGWAHVGPGFYLALIPSVVCGCIGLCAIVSGRLWAIIAGFIAMLSAAVCALGVMFIGIVASTP